MSIIAATILGATAALLPVSTDGTTASERVSTAKLDLSTERDRATLKRRLHSAATRVCDGRTGGSRVVSATELTCRSDAIAAADRDMMRMVALADQRRRLARR